MPATDQRRQSWTRIGRIQRWRRTTTRTLDRSLTTTSITLSLIWTKSQRGKRKRNILDSIDFEEAEAVAGVSVGVVAGVEVRAKVVGKKKQRRTM